MSDSRPHLVAVGDAATEPEGSDEHGAPPRRSLWIPFLFGALVVCGAGWVFARGEAERLAHELAATQHVVTALEARLALFEAQRAEVRAEVSGLSADAAAFAGRLEELEALLAADLGAAGDAQEAGSEGTRAD